MCDDWCMDNTTGTTYRDLTNAESAIELARFHEARIFNEPRITENVDLVLHNINAAIKHLEAAKAKLTGW